MRSGTCDPRLLRRVGAFLPRGRPAAAERPLRGEDGGLEGDPAALHARRHRRIHGLEPRGGGRGEAARHGDEWIDRCSQAHLGCRLAAEVERKGPSAEGSRKSILLSSLRAISNQILPFLRRRWCRPSPPQNGAAGEGFPSEARWHGRSAPHVVPASLDLADGRAHDILCFFFF